MTTEEAALVKSLATCCRGNYGGVKLVLRKVNVPAFTPQQAHALAASSSRMYPSGVVVLHLGHSCAYLVTASTGQFIHVGCAVGLLRLRLSVGVVLGRGDKVYALQVGRREAPLLKLLPS